jgi:protein-export membrane protein SecD
LAQTEEDTATSDTVQTPPRESQDAVVDIKELLGEEASVSPTDTTVMVDRESMTEHPFYTLLRNVENNIGVPEKNYSIVNRILHRREIQNLLPPDYEFLWSKLAEEAPDGNKYYRLYLLKKEPELIGKYLNDAQVQIGGGGDDASSTGLPIVTLEMNREGARIFSRVTGANVGKFLAIVLDNKVHMAPRIKTKIPDGRAIIEGSKDMEEAKDLAIVLRAGALPAPVEIIEERTVGPSLGSDSVKKGTLSGLGGLIFVILFMIWYYRLGGLIADLALILNVLFIMAVLAGFHGTLTLPGIAGIILTIGMAVDANVLIYERIREELRTGKTIKAAIEAGYSRAVVVIFDSNLTTLMSAIVLYQFGTGPIRGFALTLMIGLSASMFTAIVVTRAIFDWYTAKYNPQVLRI